MNISSDLYRREYELRIDLASRFIDAAQVSVALGCRYYAHEGQLQNLFEQLPDPEIFRRVHDPKDFVVIAGPPKDMNLFHLHALNRKLFMLTWKELLDQSWYEATKQVVVPAGEWIVLHRVCYDTFTGPQRHWLQLQANASSWLRPNIATLVYAHSILAQLQSTFMLNEQQLIPSTFKEHDYASALSVCLYHGKVYIQR